MAKVCSGYPRFVQHPYIVEFTQAYIRSSKLQNSLQPLFFSTCHALQDALQLHPQFQNVQTDGFMGVPLITVKKGSQEELALSKYIQHTGTGLSSREAEDLLSELGKKRPHFNEPKVLTGGKHSVKPLLHNWFDPACKSVVLPCKSGMNAFYSAFKGVNQLQVPQGRRDWISVGWLYLDTLKILNQYLERGGKSIWFKDALETDRIISFIKEKGSTVAGLILEVPTNPLVHTPDIQRITKACKNAGIMTVMDPSLVSPKNVDLSPWCDVTCCSLTKYAVHEGDVMIGAVAINMESEFGDELESVISRLITPPYHRDLARLGGSLENAEKVLDSINANTMILADFFENHPSIEQVYWAYSASYKDHYSKIHRSAGRPGSVITLKLKNPIQEFYDPLPLPKGPSFGTSFTLVCAYIHLAHYDLIKTKEGRKQMAEAGVDANMLRLSIGTEKPKELIRIFEKVL